MAGNLVISGTQTGIPSGQRLFSITFPVAMSNNEATTNVTLSSGANTITVPTGATKVIIIPPAANTQTLTLKGVTGDTGIPLSPTDVAVIPFPASPPANIVVTAGGATTGETAFIFV